MLQNPRRVIRLEKYRTPLWSLYCGTPVQVETLNAVTLEIMNLLVEELTTMRILTFSMDLSHPGLPLLLQKTNTFPGVLISPVFAWMVLALLLKGVMRQMSTRILPTSRVMVDWLHR